MEKTIKQTHIYINNLTKNKMRLYINNGSNEDFHHSKLSVIYSVMKIFKNKLNKYICKSLNVGSN